MGIEEILREIGRLKGESAESQGKANAEFQELRKRIEDGGSTGDSVRDYAIACLCSMDPTVEKPHRDFAEKLAGRKGSEVLFVHKTEQERLANGEGCFPAYFTRVHKVLQLGVLTSDVQFDIKRNGILVPTEAYAELCDYGDWQRKEGSLKIWRLDMIPDFMHWLLLEPDDDALSFKRHQREEYTFAVHVGEEVQKYFAADGRFDVSYVQALKLLGREAPADFQRVYDRELHKEKLTLLGDLRELTERDSRLEHELERLYKPVRTSGERKVIVDIGDVIEDIPDSGEGSRVALSEYRRDLKQAREKITRLLRNALDLGMHETPWELRGDAPGITINVPVYISKLCEKYEIPRTIKPH